MRVAQEKVRQFHEKYGYAAPDKPELGASMLAFDRFKIMREELEEYFAAAANNDLTKIADGIADLLYTVLGTAVVHGIDVQPIFDEVHRSNMTKEPPAVDKPLKPVKGATYEKPRIAELLLIQGFGDLDNDSVPAHVRWPNGAPT